MVAMLANLRDNRHVVLHIRIDRMIDRVHIVIYVTHGHNVEI